jgi:hypothetical protein
MTSSFPQPPRPYTQGGAKRRVGVEIEYSDLGVPESAALVQRLFGGEVIESDLHLMEVRGTRHGDFLVELDLRLLHRNKAKAGKQTAGDDEFARFLEDLDRELTKAAGDLAGLLVPCEIACTPIPFDELEEIEDLIATLRDAGATGTDASLLAAFGLQLNVELASLETDDILRQLRAYFLLSDWLREEIGVNFKRRLATFIDPFPRGYIDKVIDPGYRPGRSQLIEDYLAANPTRYKELDLLPLFAHLDEARVRRRLPEAKIKPRPAFHYRLPDSRIDQPHWRLAHEWRRWLRVEELAADEALLARLQEAYLEHRRQILPIGWSERLRHILRSA